MVQSISYVIDPDTGEIMRNPLGEPVINLRHSIIIAAEFPEEKLKKEEGGGEGGG